PGPRRRPSRASAFSRCAARPASGTSAAPPGLPGRTEGRHPAGPVCSSSLWTIETGIALAPRRGYERLHGTFFPLVVSSDAMVGEAVGEYRIVRELGRGRAGVVFLAESPRPARPVA